MNSIIRWFPVWGRAACYFVIGFIAPMLDQISDILSKDHWPTPQRWTLAILGAAIGASNALRAYFDGSVKRHADALAEQDKTAGQTVEAK